jgi:predicted nucleic acid-binding Zn finger protein
MTNTTRPTKSEIFTAYNKARAQARRAGDTKQVERLNKALGVMLSKSYYTGEKADYMPTHFSCNCKDWQFKYARRRAYTGPCKHMLAESLLMDIQSRRADHALPAYLSGYARLTVEAE